MYAESDWWPCSSWGRVAVVVVEAVLFMGAVSFDGARAVPS
jgi:hypothetical protein